MSKKNMECSGAGPVELRDKEMTSAQGGIIAVLVGPTSTRGQDASNGLLIGGDGVDFMEGGEGFGFTKS